MPKESNLLFATYHPHFKEKIISNQTQTFVCAADCLYLYGLSNLSVASFLAHNGGACTAELCLVTKKRESPRTSLYLLSQALQSPSPFLSLTLSKMCPAIFESMMSNCAAMSKWQFSLTLASFSLLADNSSVKLTIEKVIKAVEDYNYLTFSQNLLEVSFNLSCDAQIVKFSPNNGIIQLVQLVVFTDSLFKDNSDLLLQINYITCLANANKEIKFKRVTFGVLAAELYAISHRFDIEK